MRGRRRRGAGSLGVGLKATPNTPPPMQSCHMAGCLLQADLRILRLTILQNINIRQKSLWLKTKVRPLMEIVQTTKIFPSVAKMSDCYLSIAAFSHSISQTSQIKVIKIPSYRIVLLPSSIQSRIKPCFLKAFPTSPSSIS